MPSADKRHSGKTDCLPDLINKCLIEENASPESITIEELCDLLCAKAQAQLDKEFEEIKNLD